MNAKVSFITNKQAYAVIRNGIAQPIGESGVRYWSRKSDLVKALKPYGLCVGHGGVIRGVAGTGSIRKASPRVRY